MKTLLREWTEHHKMKNTYGEVEEVVVTCKEYEVKENVIERYAVGNDFGTPVYGEFMYADSESEVCNDNQ